MNFEGLELIIPDSVYEPAEDSFLLAKYAATLAGNLKGRILEIGCGSGIVSLAAARADKKNEVIGVDINPQAVECSVRNAKKNKIPNVRFMESNLFGAVKKTDKFDLILFNPPYLPTATSEKLHGAINAAFDGGRGGRKVLDEFLKEFGKHLKPNGTLLLVQSSLNNLEKTKRALAKKKFTVEILETQSFFFEKLYLLRARRGI